MVQEIPENHIFQTTSLKTITIFKGKFHYFPNRGTDLGYMYQRGTFTWGKFLGLYVQLAIIHVK